MKINHDSCFKFHQKTVMSVSLVTFNLVWVLIQSYWKISVHIKCLASECHLLPGFPSGSDGKESACNAGDPGLSPGSERSPGEGNGYPVQHFCLEIPHGQRSLVGYSPWGSKESDTTEWLTLSRFIPKSPKCVTGQGLGPSMLIRDLVAERFLKSSPIASRVGDPVHSPGVEGGRAHE